MMSPTVQRNEHGDLLVVEELCGVLAMVFGL